MIILILFLLAYLAVHAHGQIDGSQTLTTITSGTQTLTIIETRAPDAPKYEPPLFAGSRFFSAFAFRKDSPIHLEHVAVRNFSFWLGGLTASYCPEVVQEQGGCDQGNYTAFAECTMAISAPGGQSPYSNSWDGSLAYTRPHSNLVPNWEGAVSCPFVYTGPSEYTEGRTTGVLIPRDNNAKGFMACPTAGNEWKMFLNIDNATVPSGNVQDCLPFGLLTLPTGNMSAVWQYM